MDDGTHEYNFRSIMVGRLPRQGDNEFKTVSIKMFNLDNAHKSEEMPVKELSIPDIEKVRFRHLFTTYYLEGNDIIINHLEKLHIAKKGKTLVIRGIQGSVGSIK